MRKADGTVLGDIVHNQVKIGGLGFITGGDIASDGSYMVCWADVGGAYIQAANSEQWLSLITPARMTIPSRGSAVSGQDTGVYAMSISKSTPSVALMAYRGRMLRSTNSCATFIDDALNGSTGLYMGANDGTMRLRQHKLMHDPSNSNVAYLGTQNDGVWQRLSTGWSKIASIPNANLSDNATLIAVDPTSATTGSAPNVRKSVIYFAVSGRGLYKSTDGGVTAALITGHPGAGASFALSGMVCDQNGKLWICVDTGALGNLYTTVNGGTSWVNLTTYPGDTYNIGSVEVDPKDATRVVGFANGFPIFSTNGVTTWNGGIYFPDRVWAAPTACPIAASEAQFQCTNGQVPGSSNILPHPTLNKDMWWGGYGVYFLPAPWPAPASKSLVLCEYTKGIEELVTYHADIHPDGYTFLSAGDRGIIRQDKTGKYATINWPNGSLTDGTNVDYAIDNPAFKVGIAHRGGLTDFSGTSSDSGKTWTAFATSPSVGTAGNIAVSNSNQIVYAPAQNYWPKYTSDGITWTYCNFVGFPRITDGTENGFGFGAPFNYRRRVLCADKNNPGVFYIYNYGPASAPSARGVWKSTDGGHNFNLVGDPGTNNFGWHAGLFCTNNSDLYIFTGPLSSTITEDVGLTSFRSVNGGVNWTGLNNINEVNCMAWGAAKPNATVPYTLWCYGWLDPSGIFGLYASEDRGNSWLGPFTSPPNSYYDWPNCLAADPVIYSRLITGYGGTGYQEGLYDYKSTTS